MCPDRTSPHIVGLRLLGRRELSETQLRAKLARRKFTSKEVDDAIAQLRNDGSLDDRRTARAFARSEISLRQRGRIRILSQLENIGISKEIALDAVAEVFSNINEGELLNSLLEKRLEQGASLTDQASLRRIYRYLIAQGFEPSKVAELVFRRRNNHDASIIKDGDHDSLSD